MSTIDASVYEEQIKTTASFFERVIAKVISVQGFNQDFEGRVEIRIQNGIPAADLEETTMPTIEIKSRGPKKGDFYAIQSTQPETEKAIQEIAYNIGLEIHREEVRNEMIKVIELLQGIVDLAKMISKGYPEPELGIDRGPDFTLTIIRYHYSHVVFCQFRNVDLYKFRQVLHVLKKLKGPNITILSDDEWPMLEIESIEALRNFFRQLEIPQVKLVSSEDY